MVESPRAFDGRLIHTLRDVHVVSAAICGVAALVLRAAAGIVCAEVFDHVVLEERVVRPAVDAELCSAGRLEIAAVIDSAVGCA